MRLLNRNTTVFGSHAAKDGMPDSVRRWKPFYTKL